MKTSIILVAAGKGERFGQPKWQVRLMGKTLLEWCLETLEPLEFEKEVIVVGADGLPGGETRHASVLEGLKQAKGELVILHNVANPLASGEDFQRVHQEIMKHDVACFVGQRAVDTLRQVKDGASATLDRSDVWRVQTPQGFRRESLMNAVETNQDPKITDEIQLFEPTGKVLALETSPMNQKITYPEDLEMMERFLSSETLVGIGEDSHPFDASGTMMLGGVEVLGLPKLKGNSDGDVILHALFNAISSAIGERSLGVTADPMAEQGIIDSSEYLKIILDQVKKNGFMIKNVSISLECAQPKIEPLIEQLKASLSELFSINPQQVGITATSGEGLTPFGKGEGVKCSCVVSLKRYSLSGS
ncbi:MAG: 2-C-methyl-D-erythritol 2,4-cyclodiphosphate synthase [Candidatus Altimarinota bacterium]